MQAARLEEKERDAVISYKKIVGRGAGFLSDDLILAICYEGGLFGLSESHSKYLEIVEARKSEDANAKGFFAFEHLFGPHASVEGRALGLEMLREAARSGGVRAKTLLGYLYEHGIEHGIKKILKKDALLSKALYFEALEAGDGKAAYYLGLNFNDGANGFPKNVVTARQYYECSAELGSHEGKIVLGYCYSGDPEDSANKKANRLYKEAMILGGHINAEYGFATNCLNGKGIERNIPLALFHFSNVFKKNPEYNFVIRKKVSRGYSLSVDGSLPLSKEKCLDVNQIITIIKNFSVERAGEIICKRICEDESTLIYDVVSACRNNLSLEDMERINQVLIAVPEVDGEKNASVKAIRTMIEERAKEVDVISPLAGLPGAGAPSSIAKRGDADAAVTVPSPLAAALAAAKRGDAGAAVTVPSPLAAALAAAKLGDPGAAIAVPLLLLAELAAAKRGDATEIPSPLAAGKRGGAGGAVTVLSPLAAALAAARGGGAGAGAGAGAGGLG